MTDANIGTSAWRDQVAAAVRSVKVISHGGTCMHRLVLGSAALTHLGMRPRPVIGSTICRVGQDRDLDVIAFCAIGNVARLPGQFHVWLETDDNIVDFSCGDWCADWPRIQALSEKILKTPERRPINFEIGPPPYIWCPKKELAEPWRPTGAPELGSMWYHEGVGGTSCEAEVRAYFDEAAAEVAPLVRMAWPQVQAALPPPLQAPLPKPPGRAEARRLRQMQKRAEAR